MCPQIRESLVAEIEMHFEESQNSEEPFPLRLRLNKEKDKLRKEMTAFVRANSLLFSFSFFIS